MAFILDRIRTIRPRERAVREPVALGGGKFGHTAPSVGANPVRRQLTRHDLFDLGCASEGCFLGSHALAAQATTAGALVRMQHVMRMTLMNRLVESAAMGTLVRLLAARAIDVHAVVVRSAVVVLTLVMMRRMTDAATLGTLHNTAALALGPIMAFLGVLALAVMLGATTLLEFFGFLGRILRAARIPLRLGGHPSSHTVLAFMT